MTAKNRDQYQGLLIPDVRTRQPAALWDAESTYTEASPRPGRPVPSRDTEALLLAAGAQADGTVLDLLAVEGGPVGRDPRAAGIAWKNSGDGANAYRGREIPATFSGREIIDWRTGAGTGLSHPDAITLRQDAYRDRVVVVAQEAPSTSIVTRYRDTDGTISSKVTIHDGATLGHGLTPCLVECGDRLFCLHWAPGTGSAVDEFFLRVQMSLDGGATWETVRQRATRLRGVVETVGFTGSKQYEPRHLSAAYLRGQVVVVAHFWENISSAITLYNADVMAQWASSNLATKLERVRLDTASAVAPAAGQTAVIAAGGMFIKALAATDGTIYVGRSGSAYDSIGGTDTGQAAGSLATTGPPRQTDADITLVADDVGLLWLYYRVADTADNDKQRIRVLFSEDDGEKWETVGSSDTPGTGTSSLWGIDRTGAASNAGAYLTGLAATWQRGRAIMAHTWVATTGTNDESLALAYLGGYSDLTIAPIEAGAELTDRHPWQYTLLPIERAQDLTMWTATTAGVTSNSLQSDGSEILTSGDGATSSRFFVTATDGTTGDALMVATFAAKGSNSGASSTADRCAFAFRVDDGTRGVEVGIYLSASEFGVYDRVTPVQKALVTGLADEVREWRIGVYASEDATVKRCRVWYRSWDQSEDRTWTFVGAYSLADDGGTVGSNRVQFGSLSNGVTQADLEVYHGPHWTVGDTTTSTCLAGSAYTWDVWAAATDNPDHLSLTPMSSLPVYVSGGVSVRAVDGPAMASDSWTLAPAYEYPIERVWPSYARSPRVRWRSVDDTAQVTIALSLDPDLLGTVDSAVGSPLLGLHLAGINWRFGSIQRYTGAAWVTVTTIDAATAFGNLGCTRTGATVVPSADTTHQIAGQELIGWDYRELAPPGVVRRIKANRGGRWATGTTAGPRASLMLDKIDNTEATSTDAVLSARNLCVVFEHAAATAAAGWRLVIDVQDTVEGWFEIGSLMFGPVWVSGQPTDWGRRTEQVLGTAYRRQQDGAIQAAQPTPAGMAVDVAWTGGVDSRQFHDGTAEPTYITTTATSGITGPATWAATVYDLQHELAGLGSHPVVYLPKIERAAAGDVRQLTRWYEYLLAYVPDGLTVTHAVGDEGTDETMTVGTLTLEPEL
jgi:hypothetical protein